MKNEKREEQMRCEIGEVFLLSSFGLSQTTIYTSVKIIKNEVGCRDDTVPKTVDTRRHCEEE